MTPTYDQLWEAVEDVAALISDNGGRAYEAFEILKEAALASYLPPTTDRPEC